MEKIKQAEKYFVTDPSEAVKIYKNENLKSHRESLTTPQFLENTVKLFPNHPALKYKVPGEEEWKEITYTEYKNKVEKIAKSFIKIGFKQHGSVAVLAANSPEWFFSQLGAIHAGGFVVGIYNTNSADVCEYILKSTRTSIIVVDDTEQLNKILKIKDKLPDLKNIIKIHYFGGYDKKFEGFYSWQELEEMDTEDCEDEYQKRLGEVSANECCSIIFTSGTTGNPKGVMLSHDNLIWNSQNITEVVTELKMGQEVFVSYLPLSHVAAQVADIFLPISVASTVYFADKNALKGSLMKTLVDVRPTFFFAVPRVYEKIHEKFSSATRKIQGLKGVLMSWAQHAASRFHSNRDFSLQYEVAKIIILNKIKRDLGLDQAKICLVGGASSNEETLKFFNSLDLPIVDAYGMTETSGVISVSSPKTAKFGSVGKLLPEIEAKILNPDESGSGQICLRGRNIFMGYINELEKTKETIDDDKWVQTGDVGRIDKEGYLFVTGRIKELIITAGGENIPFLHVENLVKRECLAISNAFLIGDKRKFLSMLITLKTEVDVNNAPLDDLAADSLKFMIDLGLSVTKLSEAYNNPKVIEAIQAAINRANENAIANFQKVQKFAILPSEFSMSSGEFSPTLKLKRSFVCDKYKSIIDKFYA